MESEKAREDLKVIRQIMSTVSPPFSVSGWAGVGWGIVLLIGGIITHVFWVKGSGSFQSSVLTSFWICLLIIGSTMETFFYLRKCLLNGLPLFTQNLGYSMLGFSAIMIAGFAFHMIFSHLGQHLYIPGVWMLMIGTGCIFFGLFTSMEICVMGVLSMVGGLLAVGPFLNGSFLVLALFGGVGMILWGFWVNQRLGE